MHLFLIQVLSKRWPVLRNLNKIGQALERRRPIIRIKRLYVVPNQRFVTMLRLAT